MKSHQFNTDKSGSINVYSNGVGIGVIEALDHNGPYRFFPKRQDLIDGHDYIAVGNKLNLLNINSVENEK